MIQRIQTIFWILAIVLIILFLNQRFDEELGLKIFQEPQFSIFSTLSILLNLAAIFTFRKRQRQIFFSTASLILLFIQIGMLFYKEQLLFMDKYLMAFIYLLLGIVSNALGGYFTKQDMKLLESSSRLR